VLFLVGTRFNQGAGTRTNRRKVTDVPVSQEKYKVNRLSNQVRQGYCPASAILAKPAQSSDISTLGRSRYKTGLIQ
jgi:hypothetical protein